MANVEVSSKSGKEVSKTQKVVQRYLHTRLSEAAFVPKRGLIRFEGFASLLCRKARNLNYSSLCKL